MRTYLEAKNILFINQNRSIIDLDPAFQRGKVWAKSKQQLFIDTILRGWGVPKIYLAAYRENGKIYKYECIDGKQRLTAVFDFFDDNFPIDISGEDVVYTGLDLNTKEKLGKYSFDVEIAEDFDDQELSDLFQRLQAGSGLNTSEKLKAIVGDMSEFIFELSGSKLFTEKIKSKVKRNPHLATIAQVSLLSMRNDIVSLKFKDLSSFIKTYVKFNKNGEDARKIKSILEYIDNHFDAEDARKVFTNRAMFVSCFYLISYLMVRGDISKIKIKEFFVDFSKRLAAKKSDPNLKDFQIAVVQGADSSSSIRIRHKILVDSLVGFDKNVASLLNHEALEDEFRSVYKKKLKIFFGKHSDLDKKLIAMKCRVIMLTNGKSESLPIYIRHSNEHPRPERSYKYNEKDLKYSIAILRKIK